MTAEYGSLTQLEKIEMLDHADFVVVNKFERRGSEDTLRHVVRQVKRNRRLDPALDDKEVMAFGTIASRFNDSSVTALFENVVARIGDVPGALGPGPRADHRRTRVRLNRRSLTIALHRPVAPQPCEGRRASKPSPTIRHNRASKPWSARTGHPHEPLPVKSAIRGGEKVESSLWAGLGVSVITGDLALVAHLDTFRDKCTYRVRAGMCGGLTTGSSGAQSPAACRPRISPRAGSSASRTCQASSYAGGVFLSGAEDPTRMFTGGRRRGRTPASTTSRKSSRRNASLPFDSLTLWRKSDAAPTSTARSGRGASRSAPWRTWNCSMPGSTSAIRRPA
jgi:hypothetical protein